MVVIVYTLRGSTVIIGAGVTLAITLDIDDAIAAAAAAWARVINLVFGPNCFNGNISSRFTASNPE